MVGLAIGAGKGLSSVSERYELSKAATYALVIVVEVNALMNRLFVYHALVP